MIVPRLVLGTARIAGGVSERAAVDLVKSAFDAGVCQVDTAPSYGMGTAEVVVGKALIGHPQVSVATKLGSARPGQPWLRTVMREFKRRSGTASLPEASFAPERIAAVSGNDFSAEAMARSLELSLERLGRIDLLLLHDVTAVEVTESLLGRLEALNRSVSAGAGYASFAQFDPELDRLFPAGMTAQCAMVPGWLSGALPVPPAQNLRLHSVVKTGLALAARDSRFATALEQAARLVPASDPLTARIAAIYALAAVRIPGAQLLFTSSRTTRLKALTAALKAVDEGQQADEIAKLFPDQTG